MLRTQNPRGDQPEHQEAENQSQYLQYAKLDASGPRDIRLGSLDSLGADVEHPRKNENHREPSQRDGHQDLHRIIGEG